MPTISGTISKVYKNRVASKYSKAPDGKSDSYRYLIDGEYYSGGFKKWKGEEGDSVTIDYETKNGYHNIKEMWVTDAASAELKGGGSAIVKSMSEGFPIGLRDKGRAINRQNALTNAVAYLSTYGGSTCTPEDVIKVARTFELYTTGDMERLAAEAALGVESEE